MGAALPLSASPSFVLESIQRSGYLIGYMVVQPFERHYHKRPDGSSSKGASFLVHHRAHRFSLVVFTGLTHYVHSSSPYVLSDSKMAMGVPSCYFGIIYCLFQGSFLPIPNLLPIQYGRVDEH